MTFVPIATAVKLISWGNILGLCHTGLRLSRDYRRRHLHNPLLSSSVHVTDSMCTNRAGKFSDVQTHIKINNAAADQKKRRYRRRWNLYTSRRRSISCRECLMDLLLSIDWLMKSRRECLQPIARVKTSLLTIFTITTQIIGIGLVYSTRSLIQRPKLRKQVKQLGETV